MIQHLAGTRQRVSPSRMSFLRVTAALFSATLLLSACSDDDTTGPSPLTTLTISPTTQSVAINGTQQYTVTGRDANGNNVTVTPTWSVVANGGTISSTGLFTAGTAAGSFPNTISATSNGVTALASVNVTAGSLSAIAITPGTDTLSISQTRQFTAVGRDASGNTVPANVTWTADTVGGGTISATGLFTAGTRAGTYSNTVTATSGSTVSRATIVVRPGALASVVVSPSPVAVAARGTQTFTAMGRDASGNTVPLTNTTWSIAAGGGTITSAGVFTAGDSVGTFTNSIRATSGTMNGAATVSVTAGAVTTLMLSPNPVTISTGSTQQFTVVARDAGMNVVTVTPRWSVVGGGGTIDSMTGRYTAGMTAGSFANTVRATVGAIVGSATVNLTSALSTMTISPNPAMLVTGGTQQFTATGRAANGDTVVIMPRWTVVSGGGTIDSMTGRFTAGTTAGSFASTVRATSGTVSALATVQIAAPAPRIATITVSPTTSTVTRSGTRQFTSVARDASGAVIAHTPVWSVTAGGGTINATTGLFTAGTLAGTYAGSVRATVDSTFGAATIEVLSSPAPTIVAINVSPSTASLMANGTQTFTATGRDTYGNNVPITPVWSVVNGGGSINSTTGVFTAGSSAGTYSNSVRATLGDLVSNTTVTVLPSTQTPLVNLGLAASSGIMAGASVTCVTGGTIGADVSVSPGNTLTGFGPCTVAGTQNLANTAASNAQLALTQAYNSLAAMPCAPANAISANLGGTTKTAGVYCSAGAVSVTGTLTLDGGGDPNATFVFLAGTSLTTAGNVVLINGAQAKNVYWLVGSSATLGTGSMWRGNVIALTSITLVDNATLVGRALARNGSVMLGNNNVITLP